MNLSLNVQFDFNKKVNMIAQYNSIVYYFFFIQQLQMRALNPTQKGSHSVEEQQEQNMLMKKYVELQNLNKQKQTIISKHEQAIKALEQQNQALDLEIQKHQKEWKQLQIKVEEEKSQSQDEQQMHNWIESVQKYNGLPQAAIDSLCSIQYQGGQQQICLSCYQELSAGAMCTYLPCCHLFHKDCIGNHLKINKMCPACQEIVTV